MKQKKRLNISGAYSTSVLRNPMVDGGEEVERAQRANEPLNDQSTAT